jgi:meso-butanediol dehydrogenase/(S,S)-butanediol dehydrogenase/diacetyl reductase
VSEFRDKVVVITGTGSGQGRVAAELFAAEGAIVFGADRNIAASIETKDRVAAAGGKMVSTHPVDLTIETEVREWIDSIVAEHGRVDVLYANAGATRFSSVEATTFDDWQWVMRHELHIVFLTVKYARPLITPETGSVVLVGSTAGIRGSMTNARIAHTASKGGVVAMTSQLAAEGASRGIRCNCVSPGMIRTPATESDLLAADHPMRDIASHIPLGRIGTPEDVVHCAMFLSSSRASYITGANIIVDGGWSAVLPGRLLRP